MKANEGNVVFEQCSEDLIGNRLIKWNLQYLPLLLFFWAKRYL